MTDPEGKAFKLVLKWADVPLNAGTYTNSLGEAVVLEWVPYIAFKKETDEEIYKRVRRTKSRSEQ